MSKTIIEAPAGLSKKEFFKKYASGLAKAGVIIGGVGLLAKAAYDIAGMFTNTGAQVSEAIDTAIASTGSDPAVASVLNGATTIILGIAAAIVAILAIVFGVGILKGKSRFCAWVALIVGLLSISKVSPVALVVGILATVTGLLGVIGTTIFKKNWKLYKKGAFTPVAAVEAAPVAEAAAVEAAPAADVAPVVTDETAAETIAAPVEEAAEVAAPVEEAAEEAAAPVEEAAAEAVEEAAAPVEEAAAEAVEEAAAPVEEAAAEAVEAVEEAAAPVEEAAAEVAETIAAE